MADVKLRPISSMVCATVLIATAFAAAADNVTLKSGETIEGKIVAETNESVEIELAGYAGISKVLRKSDIETIQRAAPPPPKPAPAEVDQPVSLSEPATPFAFSGNAFDFAMILSKSRAWPVSVDPSVLRELSETAVNIAEPSVAPARQLLESELKPHGFMIESVWLAPGIDVSFVTTPAVSSYFGTIAELRKGNLKAGYDILRATPADDSEFGRHGRELRLALEVVLQRNGEMNRLESELREGAEKLKMAKAVISAAELAANTAYSQADFRQAIGYAENRYRSALDEMNKTYSSLQVCLERGGAGDETIDQRFRRTGEANLQSEMLCLTGNIEESHSRLVSMLDRIRREIGISSTNAPGGFADELRAERSRLSRLVQEGEQHAKAGAVFLASDPAMAHKLFLRAFDVDSGALLTRVGTGYCALQRNIAALKSVFGPDAQSHIESRRQTLETEFRRYGKFDYLRALYEAQSRPLPPLDTTTRTQASLVRDSTGVAAALTRDGVELVIVAKENEPELLLVPVDELCRLTIVVADDVDAYTKSGNPQQLERALHGLRVAQMRLLLGDREPPVKLLQSVVATHPELYNARRLLELLRIQR